MKLIADNHNEPSNEELGIRPHRGYIIVALIGLFGFWVFVGWTFVGPMIFS